MSERYPIPSHSKAKEGLKSPELFRASLGFDFIFSKDAEGKTNAYCVEINGHDTGISGMAAIPKNDIDKTTRVLAQIRDTADPEYSNVVANNQEILDRANAAQMSEGEIGELVQRLHERAENATFLSHSFKNPGLIDNIARNKSIQQDFIPPENRPRVYKDGDSPVSSTGYWICKPNTGRGGEGILIFSNSEFLEEFRFYGMSNAYIVEEFIPALGADRATAEMKTHPASLRLLIDFRYLKDGTIDQVSRFAYQRVSPFAENDTTDQNLSKEDIYVVNKARGAKSAAVSENELKLAQAVTEKIIRNLAENYESTLPKQ